MKKRKYQSVLSKLRSDRAIRSFSYFLLGTGGIVALFYPSPIVSPVTSPSVSLLWAGLLAFGALLCFVSIIIDNWVLEYVGLPLLSAGFLVYAICALLSVTVDFPFYMTSGLFNLGVSSYMFSRFWVLRNQIYDSELSTSRVDLE